MTTFSIMIYLDYSILSLSCELQKWRGWGVRLRDFVLFFLIKLKITIFSVLPKANILVLCHYFSVSFILKHKKILYYNKSSINICRLEPNYNPSKIFFSKCQADTELSFNVICAPRDFY